MASSVTSLLVLWLARIAPFVSAWLFSFCLLSLGEFFAYRYKSLYANHSEKSCGLLSTQHPRQYLDSSQVSVHFDVFLLCGLSSSFTSFGEINIGFKVQQAVGDFEQLPIFPFFMVIKLFRMFKKMIENKMNSVYLPPSFRRTSVQLTPTFPPEITTVLNAAF